MKSNNDNQNIQSIERALVLLKHLSSDPFGLSLKDLGQKTGLPASTIHRLLSSLVNQNFAVRDEKRHLYFAGPGIWELQGEDMRDVISKFSDSDRHLTQLRDTLGHTLHLAVLDYRRLDVITIKKKEGNGVLRVVRGEEDEDLAYCTATGRVLLSDLSNVDLERYFSTHSVVKRTPHTITDALHLKNVIEMTRTQQWSMESNEFYDGVTCIGVPVRNAKGRLIAALSISAPSTSQVFLSISSLLPVLNQTALDIGKSYNNFSNTGNLMEG